MSLTSLCMIPLARLREDSQIDFATRNVYLHVSLRPPTSCLETFQSKIDNQFKMCALAEVDDTKIRSRPANGADQSAIRNVVAYAEFV